MKALDIALKDLTSALRSISALGFMIVVPLLVTSMFYFMFGNIAEQGEFNLPVTQVAAANLDRNGPSLRANNGNAPGELRADTLSGLVIEILQGEELSDLLQVTLVPDEQAVRAAVDSGQAQVGLIIPEGFSRQFADPYDQSYLEFYQDPTLTFGPSIVESFLNQFMNELSGVKIAVKVALDQSLDGALNGEQIGQIVGRFLETSPSQADDLSSELLEIRPPGAAPLNTNPILSIVGPIMGGMMIFYAFYTGAAMGEGILKEEEQRTLPRLFTTPTAPSTILSGKLLSVFLTVLVQVSVLLAAGRLVFGVRWGDWRSLLLVLSGVVLLASSFGIFVNSWMRSTKQSGLIFGGVLTITGMIGMIRIFALNSASAEKLGNSVSLLTPQGWAVRALLQTMQGDLFGNVALTTIIMLAWSAFLFSVGVWRFKRRYL